MESPSPKRKIRKRFIALALIALLIAAFLFLLSPHAVTLTAGHKTYRVDDDTVTCTWRNGTLRTLLYGRHFTLERLEGETWKGIPINTLFEDIGFTLLPLGSRAMTYDLSGLYPLPTGQYRICAQFMQRRNRTPHTAYAHFTLVP